MVALTRYAIRSLKVTLVLLLACFSACYLNVNKAVNVAVISGYEKLPIAASLRDKFGAVSCITHFNLPTRGYTNDEKDWHTVTVINGRYGVNYVQKITLNFLKTKVIQAEGDGNLYIDEIKKVFLQDGSIVTRNGGFQKVITGEELKKLLESNWDFSVLGYELNKEPVENIEWKIKYLNDMYPMQTSKILLPNQN